MVPPFGSWDGVQPDETEIAVANDRLQAIGILVKAGARDPAQFYERNGPAPPPLCEFILT